METMSFDRDGFLTSPESWNEELARRIAAENGVGELSEEHFRPLRLPFRQGYGGAYEAGQKPEEHSLQSSHVELFPVQQRSTGVIQETGQ